MLLLFEFGLGHSHIVTISKDIIISRIYKAFVIKNFSEHHLGIIPMLTLFDNFNTIFG